MSEPDYQDERKDSPSSTLTCMLTSQCNAAVWGLYYSARESYGPLVASLNPSFDPSSASSPLDASFWHSLTEVFATNDTAFSLYRNRTVRDAPPPIGGRNCSETCRNVTICDMRAMRAEDSCVSYVFTSSTNLPFVIPFLPSTSLLAAVVVLYGTLNLLTHTLLFQFRQSLKDIDFPNKPDPNPGKFSFPELEIHEACEGSAVPSIMRKLILWSLE